MIFDEDYALEKSTSFTNLIVYDLIISMENTGGDESCINGNNEIQNTRINNMVRAGILDSDQHEKNDAVKQIHQQKYIYASSTVH